MMFGGAYISTKNFVNSISISVLPLPVVRDIYEKYPDFYLCKSEGAGLAQARIEHFNIVPADKSVLKALKRVVGTHEKNFAKGAERVCVALQGSVLTPQASIFPDKSGDVSRQYGILPDETYYLVTNVHTQVCKELLDGTGAQAEEEKYDEDVVRERAKSSAPTVKPQHTQAVTPPGDEMLFPEIEPLVTVLFKAASERNIEGVFGLITEVFRTAISREEMINAFNAMFGSRQFRSQEQTWYEYGPGQVETTDLGVYRDAMLYQYHGTISFTDGTTLKNFAVLVKESNEWKVQYFELVY
jgi:hypothetical protein